ncbi:hypothetical protein PENSPDRAFT_754497 [Peniophora sp. CONT]|nr:hypothetical protein PENSPDRAFT_754497 [Peniophora sp. CONT]
MGGGSLENGRAFWYPLADTRFACAPPNAAATSVPARLDALHAELASLEETVIRARRLCNKQSLTGRLPVEVLSSIFEFVRDKWPPSRSSNGRNARFYSGWMTVTHVCSIWRTVALGASCLWAKHANVLDTPVEYLQLILLRAGTLPFDLSMDLNTLAHEDDDEESDDSDSDSLSSTSSSSRTPDAARRFRTARSWLCRPVCLRTTRLSIRGLDQAFLTLTLAPAVLHLSGLRELHLAMFSPSTLALPKDIAELSGLVELSLEGFYMRWSSPIFASTLTCLKLDFERHNGGYIRFLGKKYSCGQFRAMLNSMESLHTLSLVGLMPSDLEEDSQVIRLPSTLRLFRFQSNYFPSCAQNLRLLERLRFPELCTRYVGLCCDRAAWAESDIEQELVRHCLQNLTSFGSHNVQDLVLSDKCVTVATSEHPISITSDSIKIHYLEGTLTSGSRVRHSGPLMAYITIRGMSSGSLGSYFSALNVMEVQTVTFTKKACLELGCLHSWDTLTAHAPHTRKFGLFFFHCLSLLHGLAERADGRFTLFPELQVLVLHGIGSSSVKNTEIIDQLNALANLVSMRKGAGAPLQEIVISKHAEGWAVWAELRAELKITFM